MKKKIILLIIIVFSTILVSCSKNASDESNTPDLETEQSQLNNEELFNKIMSEASNPTSAHLKMYTESELILADSTTITNEEHEIKYDMRDEDNIKYYSLTNSQSLLDAGIDNIELYYLDGYSYTNYGDTKLKSKITKDELFPEIDYSTATFTAEELIDFSYEEKESHTVFTYSINEDNLQENIEELKQIHGTADGIEFVTAKGETVISKDGQILKSDITIEIKVDTPALSGTIITNTYTEYYSINEDIEIKLPEDFESYIEY